MILAATFWLTANTASGGDWRQWGGGDGKNMVSPETGLPESFVPGEKDSQAGQIILATARDVKWARRLCQAIYSTPVVADGRIFLGGRDPGVGRLMCLEEDTGKQLWQWGDLPEKSPCI